jgi:hypothetical protein
MPVPFDQLISGFGANLRVLTNSPISRVSARHALNASKFLKSVTVAMFGILFGSRPMNFTAWYCILGLLNGETTANRQPQTANCKPLWLLFLSRT